MSGRGYRFTLPLQSATALEPHAAGDHDATTVMLAAVRDPAHVMAALAAALGLQESGAVPVAELVRNYLKDRELLLTLDNLEHLPGLAPQLSALLQQAPQVTLLLTSRTPTRLREEQVLQVPPLALPNTDTPEAWRASPAVALFVERARAQGRDVLARPDDLRAAAAICRRLDGLPLAIELAAARLRVLTPQALAARLQHSLPLLTGGATDAPERHQTLRGTIAWSYALLDPPTQRLFRRLGACVGGWSLEAAEALDDDAVGVIDRLESLIDHSLVQRLDDLEGAPRYAMLETLREFALEALAGSGEADALRQRHAQHFQHLALAAAPHVTSAARGPWLARLRAEQNNLRAALQWLVHERADPAAALPLVAALAWPWYFQGLYQEGRAWTAAALALAAGNQIAGAVATQMAPTQAETAWPTAPGQAAALPAAAPRVEAPQSAALQAARAAALSGAARLAAYSGDTAAALRHAEESLALWRPLNEPRGLAFALFHRGIAGVVAMQLHGARTALAEALDIFRTARRLGHRPGQFLSGCSQCRGARPRR